MAYTRKRPINLPAPYLKRVWLDPAQVHDASVYPFCLPFLRSGFELSLDKAVTIIAGENGTGGKGNSALLWAPMMRCSAAKLTQI